MSSTDARRTRQQIAKEKFVRLVPLEGYSPPKGFEDGAITELIDIEPGEVLIARVPPSCSTRMAEDIERRLAEMLKRPVLVMTSNVELCRVDPVTRDEVLAALKGATNHAVPEASLTQSDPQESPTILDADGNPYDDNPGS